jgi:hypothetical protein
VSGSSGVGDVGERLRDGGVGLGSDVRFFAARSDQRRLRLLAGDQRDRVHEHRSPGAGFAGDRRQARAELKLGSVDDGEV